MNFFETARQFKIGEYAIIDFAISFLAVFILSPFLRKIFLKIGLDIPLESWLLLTLPLSVLVHLLVGNITPMTKDFIDPQGHWVLKIILIIFVIVAIARVKRV